MNWDQEKVEFDEVDGYDKRKNGIHWKCVDQRKDQTQRQHLSCDNFCWFSEGMPELVQWWRASALPTTLLVQWWRARTGPLIVRQCITDNFAGSVKACQGWPSDGAPEHFAKNLARLVMACHVHSTRKLIETYIYNYLLLQYFIVFDSNRIKPWNNMNTLLYFIVSTLGAHPVIC